jgi:hypothetical protein
MDEPAAAAPTDPVTLILQAEPDSIRRRLRALDAERRALRQLLRVAIAATRPEREEARSA